MLFQEKAAKELLEYNNRREGPIFEGDQKYFFKLVQDGYPLYRLYEIKR